MTVNPAFWDSSALIPLCIHEPTTGHAKALASQFKRVVWWGTPVEIRSAFAREYRAGRLGTAERKIALTLLTTMIQDFDEILPNSPLRECAEDLLDRYPLRAADALQLAAALAWCQRRPARRTFISGDIRLCEAAAAEGFTVIQPSASLP